MQQQQQSNQNFSSANSGYLNLSNGQAGGAQQQNVVAAAAMAMFPGGFTSNGINLSDEHQVYEYLHQLLEEKEKLKELFNEPFNIMLPISARLLDEGKLKKLIINNSVTVLATNFEPYRTVALTLSLITRYR